MKEPELIQLRAFGDDRGRFWESFNQSIQERTGEVFVQDNFATSSKNVVRGLHFQNPPYAQAKLVSVLKGKVKDVVVDIRKESANYGKVYEFELTGDRFECLFVPVGFAHGYASLEDDTLFHYKCSNFYHPESEGAILFNDPELGIDWEVSNPIVSEKDQNASLFNEFNSLF